MEVKWIQVSYKKMRRWFLFLLVPLGLLAGAWYLLHSSGESEVDAQIRKATLTYRRASEIARVSKDPQDKTLIEQAVQDLEKAKTLKIENDYEGALTAARTAEAAADKVVKRNKRPDVARAKIRFDELIGEVMVKKFDTLDYVRATKTMALDAGDMVKTSPRSSCRLVFFDGMVTVIRPESLVTIKDAFDNRAPKDNFVNLRLDTGHLTMNSSPVSAKAKPSVLTRSGSAMVFHSSQVAVEYSALKSETELSVYEGKATAASGARTVDLHRNQRVILGDDRSLSGLIDLPDPPRLLTPSNFEKIEENPAGSTSVVLGWESIDPTASYHIELSPNILFTEWIHEDERYFRNQIEYGNLTGGVYFWRVSSIDADTVEGAPSEVYQFQIGKELISKVKAVDTKPPTLKIDEVSISGYIVIITGKTERTASVQVEGQKAISDPATGAFSFVASMPSAGVHTILVVATDPAGNRTHEELQVEIKD